MTTTTTHQLIEINPATGEEDQLISTGTMKSLSAELATMIEEFMNFDYDDFEMTWPVYRIEPLTE